MKQTARLVIPLWGAVYADKLVSLTLPALLAPGNLPDLCATFAVEVALVAEEKLFDFIRRADSFKALSRLCFVKLVSIDDLLTDLPGDYGVVLSYALFRGFSDLGMQMTSTYLLFLNVDFILCDGSLRHLGRLMREGKRVIHAPSFRVVLEEVMPVLKARLDPGTSSLAIGAREMVKLALAHKHLTVRARTVNQRLCHQWRMDQFYWYVDESTLIGYQWPVALVAIKPERVVTEPVLVWDYGFIPEASPTAERHFIADSDDFFMIEIQKRATGADLVRLGAISFDEIAKDLSKWTTKEQRDSGRQLLMIHAADLPPDLASVVHESRDYMAQIFERLSPSPQPHRGHGMLGQWFEEAKARMKAKHTLAGHGNDGGNAMLSTAPATGADANALYHVRTNATQAARRILGFVYRACFGSLPAVNRYHPLWADTHYVAAKLAKWQAAGTRILWLSSQDSLFHRWLEQRIDPAALMSGVPGVFVTGAPYGACLCEVSIEELPNFREYYRRLRDRLVDGAEVVLYVFNRYDRVLMGDDIGFCDGALPDLDISEMQLFGSRTTAAARRLYLNASNSWSGHPLVKGVITGASLVGLAPIVRLANARAAQRNSAAFRRIWTSLVINLKVKKAHAPRPDAL